MYRRLIAGVLACCLHLSSHAQETPQVHLPTSVLEMSPEVGAEFHRIQGKIEGSVDDPKQVNELQERFTVWFENAGSPQPTTFDEAQRNLLSKLQKAVVEFDEAKKSGSLDGWMLATSRPQIAGEISPTTAPVSESTASSPSVPASTSLISTEPVNPKTESVSAVKQSSSTNSKLIEAIALLVFPLVGIAAFWLYPKYFQANSAKYHQSWWQRLKLRFGFAFSSMLGYWLLLFALAAIFGN